MRIIYKKMYIVVKIGRYSTLKIHLFITPLHHRKRRDWLRVSSTLIIYDFPNQKTILLAERLHRIHDLIYYSNSTTITLAKVTLQSSMLGFSLALEHSCYNIST